MEEKKSIKIIKKIILIYFILVFVFFLLFPLDILYNRLFPRKSPKTNSFTTEIKEIYKTAQQEWIMDSMTDTKSSIIYSRINGQSCGKELNGSGRIEIDYIIKINENGNVTDYYVTDGNEEFSYSGIDLKIENIGTYNYPTKKFKKDKNLNQSVFLTCEDEVPKYNGNSVISESYYE